MEKVTRKVFVGNIPHTVTEDQLRKVLEEQGPVYSLFYMMDQTMSHKGWAFVTYETIEDARIAIQNMDGKTLFTGSLGPVEARFANQKPKENSLAFKKPEGGGAAGTGTSTTWQEFFTPEGHAYYYNTVTGATQWEKPEEWNSPQKAVPVPVPSRGTTGLLNRVATQYGPEGSNIFVFNVPSDWNDLDLIQHFQHFGNILSSRILRDNQGNSRGFGFVSFDNPQS
ncbi:clustered-asparagine-rich protein, partial [Cystoisospora suis]